MAHSFHDHIFSSLFGDTFFSFDGISPGPAKGSDSVHHLKVTLEELYNGKTKRLKLDKQTKCKSCNGVGGKNGTAVVCAFCKGYGSRVIFRELGPGMMQQLEKPCPECSGQGEIINYAEPCKACHNKCYVQESKTIEVQICPGMRDGQRIVFTGEGEEGPNIVPGDVVIVLALQPHERFELRGDNLVMKMDISLTEALCGFRIPIQLLDSRNIIINNPPGKVIVPNAIKRVKGEGFNAWPQKGDLIIKFNVVFPGPYFTSVEELTTLEKLFPREAVPTFNMADENVEAVSLFDYDDAADQARESMDTSDEGSVQCPSH